MSELDQESKPHAPPQPALVVRPIAIVAAVVAWATVLATGLFWHAIDVIDACCMALLFVGIVYWIVAQVRRGARPK